MSNILPCFIYLTSTQNRLYTIIRCVNGQATICFFHITFNWRLLLLLILHFFIFWINECESLYYNAYFPKYNTGLLDFIQHDCCDFFPIQHAVAYWQPQKGNAGVFNYLAWLDLLQDYQRVQMFLIVCHLLYSAVHRCNLVTPKFMFQTDLTFRNLPFSRPRFWRNIAGNISVINNVKMDCEKGLLNF